jgi:succinate dehydrogenase / fumarate reductase, cytochrome b subunit
MPSRLFSSSIGSKLLIALTGLGLFIFLVGHLSGNLLFLLGPDAFNQYSHTLVSNPLVYAAEAGLIAIFLLHIYKTVRLYAGSKSARPVAYARKEWAGGPSRKTWASTTMIFSGIVVLVFVVLHLRKFKFGPWYETPDGIRDLYRLQIEIFSNPGYVAFYMLAMVVIGFHLWHGIPSVAQSLGADHPKYTPRILWIGRALALLIAGGFFILPIYTYLLWGRG